MSCVSRAEVNAAVAKTNNANALRIIMLPVKNRFILASRARQKLDRMLGRRPTRCQLRCELTQRHRENALRTKGQAQTPGQCANRFDNSALCSLHLAVLSSSVSSV